MTQRRIDVVLAEGAFRARRTRRRGLAACRTADAASARTDYGGDGRDQQHSAHPSGRNPWLRATHGIAKEHLIATNAGSVHRYEHHRVETSIIRLAVCLDS